MLNQSHQLSKFRSKIKEKLDVELEYSVQQEIKEKPKDSNDSVKLTWVTNDMHLKETVFPHTASEKTKKIGSEKTKEPIISITNSDSEKTKEAMISITNSDSETGNIREKLVDYTKSSDETTENCQINVDHDCNADHHDVNVKDPMIGGKLPVDAQPSSDFEEQDEICQKLEEKIKGEELFFSNDENRTNSIVDEIISKLDVKDQLMSKSMEAWRHKNSDQLLTDAIHKSAVVVSETGEEINTVPVESKLDTTILTTISDSDSNTELIIVQKVHTFYVHHTYLYKLINKN